MAKRKKDRQEEVASRVGSTGTVSAPKPTPQGRSVLRLAWERFEAGDVVEARRVAQAALQGQVGADELEEATRLAGKLAGNDEFPVEPTIESVARVLIERTKPSPRSYVFAAASLAIFALLVTLAVTRYMS